MDFFDKIGNKISSVGKTASNKAKEFAEVSRLNSAISAEQTKISTYFSDLGKKYYELKADAPDAELAEFIQNINAAKDEIVKLNEQIEAIKAANAPRTCPTCGAQVPDDAMFCNKCGTQVPPKAVPVPDDTEESAAEESAPASVCPTCGKEVAPDAVFCVNCGAKLK